jgi:hypothetical protein
MRNGNGDNFDGRTGDELLNEKMFTSLTHVYATIVDPVHDLNSERPDPFDHGTRTAYTAEIGKPRLGLAQNAASHQNNRRSLVPAG